MNIEDDAINTHQKLAVSKAAARSMRSSPVFISNAGGQKTKARKLTNRELRRFSRWDILGSGDTQ